jgi:hypothetical protein
MASNSLVALVVDWTGKVIVDLNLEDRSVTSDIESVS